MNFNRYFLSAILTCGSLASAQVPEVPKLLAAPLGFLNSIFSPKSAALSRLLDDQKAVEADDLITKEKKYFFENKKEHSELLIRHASLLNASYAPKFDEHVSAIASLKEGPSAEWANSKDAIRKADALADEYRGRAVYSFDELRSPKFAKLVAEIEELRLAYRGIAPSEFIRYIASATTKENFFDAYPVPVSSNEVLEAARAQMPAMLAKLSSIQVIDLAKTYGAVFATASGYEDMLGKRFLESTMGRAGPPYVLKDVLDAVRKAAAAGIKSKTLPGAEIAFIEVTSRTLLSEGQIEFPVQVQMDLPFTPVKANLDTLLSAADTTTAAFVVILDVAVSRVDRRVVAKSDQDAKFVSGTRSEPNPQYDIARSKLFEAQAGLARAQAQPSIGLAAAIGNAIAITAWSSRVKEAESAVSSTASMLQKDTHSNYKYSLSDIRARRVLTAHYYVVDRAEKTVYKSTFDVSEEKAFSVAYNVHEQDPDRNSTLSRYAKESDIASYEQSPMSIKASLLLDDYVRNQGQSRPLTSLTDLREEMLKDKNEALAAYKKTQFSAKPVNDDRFDSVVVVHNPKGSSGTGFFVAPDLVLTNFHVVEGAQFIEMKLYNGSETFGKVVKTDVRLDLALIRVQTRGKPVKFFDGNNLDLGATVEAIGHPKGLNFTITRGIVSAVRKRPSVYAVGGKDILFVQTDAAINPGNSGGPLFINEAVVGVNNNKLVAGSEGLGFAIHYSEITTFLKEGF